MSEDSPYLDALDFWLGYLADRQVAVVTLVRESDDSLAWLLWGSDGTHGAFGNQVSLGSFPALVAAQEASELHFCND